MPDPDLTAPLAESLTLAQEAKRGRELRAGVEKLRERVSQRRDSAAKGARLGSKMDWSYRNALEWVNNQLDALLEDSCPKTK